MLGKLSELDVAFFESVNAGLGSKSFDGFMRFLSDEKLWVACSVILLVYAIARKSSIISKYLAVLGIAVFISDMVSFRILKPLFERKRPCYQLEHVRLVSDSCGSEFGFPSNHAANGFAMAMSLHLYTRRRWAISFYPIAIVVGFTRVYLGVHFPFDVLFGFLVGLISGYCAVKIFGRLESLYLHFKT